MSEDIRLEPGRIVRILKGRGKGSFAMVLKVNDDQSVCIGNGKTKTFDHMKRKNRKHIFPESIIIDEIAQLIRQNSSVPNKRIRFGLQQFMNQNKMEAQ